MAWIESHQEVGRHPKTKKLARLLGVSLPAAVGHLHYLWWWALDFAQDGNLSKYDAGDLADAMLWDGDEKQLEEALVAAGYIDQTDGGIVLHDWHDYAGKLLERRQKDRVRKRKSEEIAKTHQEFHRSSSGTDEEKSRSPSVPYITVPNSTVPNSTEPGVSSLRSQSGENETANPCPFSEIMKKYNETCTRLPKIMKIEGTRKKAVAARWKTFPSLDKFAELFRLADSSSFLAGNNERNWSADFDWLMKAQNMVKVLEGKYADKLAPPIVAGARGGTLGALASIVAEEEGGGL